ncbi:preprotein translocase subunit YajC [Georgenia yuyongxinii]|uniref:Preprotein translocase subunit YajC n=1 Tax=Georgenia yuyongxinii TaxID=2589797 RepID=A0A552WW65_9MICO|nr:preprotein translocase subunit YajC [Georgenia yuyongxinii]TRW47081.1 preprotein translocase subunit YajC [Georgenia yuyongxinii]
MEIFIFLALMIAMMWFVTSRGKKQQAAAREKLTDQMVPGASVMTIGGFFGKVVDIDGDVVTLESPAGDETIWLRSAIKEVKEPPFAPIEDVDDDSVVVPDDASALTAVDAIDPVTSAHAGPVEERPVAQSDEVRPAGDDETEPGAAPRA